jgi:hypothetical protein
MHKDSTCTESQVSQIKACSIAPPPLTYMGYGCIWNNWGHPPGISKYVSCLQGGLKRKISRWPGPSPLTHAHLSHHPSVNFFCISPSLSEPTYEESAPATLNKSHASVHLCNVSPPSHSIPYLGLELVWAQDQFTPWAQERLGPGSGPSPTRGQAQAPE